jgi:hypothetical protein
MNMAILESGVLNLKWNYQDTQGVRKAFEVPRSIIDVDRTKLKAGAKLSDHIVMSSNTGPTIISIVKDGVKQYELEGFLLSDFLNFIDTMAYTASEPMNGLIGAIDQIEDTLFL